MWRRLQDYEEVIAGELPLREAPGAGVPLILNWSGSVTIDGDTYGAGFVAGPVRPVQVEAATVAL